MKYRDIKYIMAATVVGFSFASCEDFLDRPGEDSYNVNTYYQTDEQLYATANTLYNSPWYDVQRGFFKTGEVFAGNYYWGSSPYLTFTLNSTDEDLVNMSASLWSVNAYANTLIKNVNEYAGPKTSEKARLAAKGEALTWKAMAYFYLVRCWDEVPIVHDNTSDIAGGNYNNVKKADRQSVYEYIVMTLEKAIEWLPESALAGRIDRYCAKALLAKVYLAKAGASGSLNNADLQKAVELSKDVYKNSGRELMPVYSDIFRLANNTCEESLIAWRWTAEGGVWTSQNTLQSDLIFDGFSEFADTWGGWAGPSVGLQDAFNESAQKKERNNVDSRRKATMMMYGDVYEYFWTDHGGFDYIKHMYDNSEEYKTAHGGKVSGGQFQSPTGANIVKHLVGDNADHVLGAGHSMAKMATSLATHILRLSDVYLILAEAQALLDGGTTSDADAVAAYNAVRGRAIATATPVTSVSWETVFAERRLELALEGDRWFDYVRLSYYDKAKAESYIKNSRRGVWYGLNEYYDPEGGEAVDISTVTYDDNWDKQIAGLSIPFSMPFPDTDLLMNPNLSEPAESVDVRSMYSY